MLYFFKGIGTAYNFLKELNLLHKINKSAGGIALRLKNGFDTHLANNPIVVTAEGVKMKLSNAMHNLNNNGGGKNVINSSKALLESAYAKIAVDLKKEIELIEKSFDKIPNGFAEFSHKPIKIAYEHILGMELDLTKKGKLSISGFHHDYKNAIEKSGIIEFSSKILDEHGFYKTTLLENGNIIKKATFFPAEWSREDVIKKIHEAYNDFKTGGAIALENRGKYVITGRTQEGIEIEMYITKNGKIVTAYPILESL